MKFISYVKMKFISYINMKFVSYIKVQFISYLKMKFISYIKMKFISYIKIKFIRYIKMKFISYMFHSTNERPFDRQWDTVGKLYISYILSIFCIRGLFPSEIKGVCDVANNLDGTNLLVRNQEIASEVVEQGCC
jgi:hypothetical protein